MPFLPEPDVATEVDEIFLRLLRDVHFPWGPSLLLIDTSALTGDVAPSVGDERTDMRLWVPPDTTLKSLRMPRDLRVW